MSPFAELGLEANADERAIKRAYAARLRQTRPEDDPQGFQALHAAYQAALASCRQRQAGPVRQVAPAPAALETTTVATQSAPTPSPVHAEVHEARSPVDRLDLGVFVQDAIVHAADGNAEALDRWLHGIEALWSLDAKAQAGHALVAAIYRQAPPMPEACLETLLAFFGQDRTLTGHDAMALHQLRRRMDLAWHLAPARRGQLARALRLVERPQQRVLDAVLKQLQQPFRWWQVLLRGLHTGFAREVAALVQRLCGGHLGLLPASLDRRQLAFWLSAADIHAIGLPRLALAGARVLATLLGSVVLGLFFGWVAGEDGAIDPGAVYVTVMLGLGLCAFVLALAAWWQLVRWQAGPAPAARWPARLHAALVPLLVGSGLAVEWLAEAPLAGWPVLLLSGWLAAARALAGRQLPGNLRLWLWIGFVMASPVARTLAGADFQPAWFTGLFAAAALGAWGFDLWRRYRPWHPARVR